MGIWGEECPHNSPWGNIVWDYHSFCAQCSSWSGALFRSKCPCITYIWQDGACVWHSSLLWYSHAKFLQITAGKNWESVSLHYSSGRGTLNCSKRSSLFAEYWWDTKSFMWLSEAIQKSLHALVTYPQLVTAARKAESDKEDKGAEGVGVKGTHAEKDDVIEGIREQVAQLSAAIQQAQGKTLANDRWSTNPMDNGNILIAQKGTHSNHSKMDKYECSKIQCYWCEGWQHVRECLSMPLHGKMGEVTKTSNLPPRHQTLRKIKAISERK